MFGHTPRSHVHSPRKISFRCAHTLWCDRNPPRRFHMRRHQSELNTRRSFFFFSPSSYHLSCMCVTFGRMLGKLWINPEAGFFQGRNLERTSSQDPTRCWSCSAIKHEILSVGRWFIILLLLLGENMEIETLKMGGNIYLVGLFFLFSLSASKFLNGFQTLIIFHSVTAITW